MTDIDVLARLRRLEAETDALRHRLAELERREKRDAAPPFYRDAPTYKRLRDAGRLPISNDPPRCGRGNP